MLFLTFACHDVEYQRYHILAMSTLQRIQGLRWRESRVRSSTRCHATMCAPPHWELRNKQALRGSKENPLRHTEEPFQFSQQKPKIPDRKRIIVMLMGIAILLSLLLRTLGLQRTQVRENFVIRMEAACRQCAWHGRGMPANKKVGRVLGLGGPKPCSNSEAPACRSTT